MSTNNKDQIVSQRDELQATIDRLKAEKAALLSAQRSIFELKVSEKGAVSMYGFGRFPVTLYRDQWTKLIEQIPAVQSFIAANQAVLKSKTK